MATSTSIATEATRTAAAQNAADYTNGIGAHVSGDWFQHNQANKKDGQWAISQFPPGAYHAPHVIQGVTTLLRFLVTLGNTDYAVIVPAIPSGAFVGTGTWSGGPNAAAPVFSVQPASASYTVNTRVVLSVTVTGTPPILLQWTRNGVAIAGANSQDYYINSLSQSNVGQYACIATNANGQTVSNIAEIGIKTSTGEPVPTRPF